MQKFLVIGCGGSGGATVRYLYRELDRRLQATGWTTGVPAAWRFMHVDVRQSADDLPVDVPVGLNDPQSHVGLAEFPHMYGHYDSLLGAQGQLLPAMAGWRPQRNLRFNPPFEGAGQRRAVGRAVALVTLDKVSAAIDLVLGEMNSANTELELAQLTQHLGAQQVSEQAAPGKAIVVTSLGGGAGSGVFLDIIQLLKARALVPNQWLADPLAILYTPDIFESLEERLRPGVEANSLAAMSELLSAYEHAGPMADAETLLIQGHGGVMQLSGNLGPNYTFLIGSGGQETGKDVYRATGKALAAIVADPKVQSQLTAFVLANWNGPAMNRLSFATADGQNAASSFGHGSVTLGRAIFSRYASERLAKAAFTRMTAGHMERVQPGTPVREERLISERADADQAMFFERSGLWELGRDHNQVLDALRQVDDHARALQQLREQVMETLKQQYGGNKLRPDEWRAIFEQEFEEQGERFITAQGVIRDDRARRWVPEIQRQLTDATVQMIGRNGLPVTLELLDRLSTQINDAAQALRQADERYRHSEEQMSLNRARAFFTSLKDKAMRLMQENLDEPAEHRRQALYQRTEADLHAMAADLLDDLADNLLVPLRRTVSRLQAQLGSWMQQKETKAVVDSWTTGAVPPHMKPSPNELVLEPVSTYPQMLDDLVMAVFDRDTPLDSMSLAIQEIVGGTWRRTDGDDAEMAQTLVHQQARWYPDRSEARATDNAAGPASFVARIDVEGLLHTASRWVRTRRGALSTHIAEGLSTWLDPAAPDAPARHSEFVRTIQQALSQSEPMAKVSAASLNRVHGVNDIGRTRIVSPIPMAADHPVRLQVVNVLDAAGIPNAAIDGLFDPTSGAETIEVMSFLGQSVHPMVMESFTAPILSEWGERRLQPRSAELWWSCRRARPLPTYIPIGPERQTAIVRGWFTSILLGHLSTLADRYSTRPLSIWTPDGTRNFPAFLLSDPADMADVLPALLEAFPLAMCAHATGGNDLDAYERLLDLGMGGDINDRLSYATPNPELRAWLEHGEVSAGREGNADAPRPPAEFCGSADDSPEQRRATAAAVVTDLHQAFTQDVMALMVPTDSATSIDSRFEIREAYSTALEELARVLTIETARSRGRMFA